MTRVVSLVPSSTETLLALGADVVACTRFCEQPSLRHVGGTKNPDIEQIIELAPDLVVLDREENRIDDHDALVAAGLDVLVSDVRSVAAGFDVVEQLAAAVGVAAPTPTRAEPVDVEARRTAFVPIWRRPWMTIASNTYGGSLLAHLGVDLVATGSDDAYPTVELDAIASQGPDLVLVPSEPYEFDDGHVGELTAAFPTSAVVRVDGQDLFWWGSRTPKAIERLARALDVARGR
jgi:ABC-type Fe3+-hydroxamate transport system substrate-binding protein